MKILVCARHFGYLRNFESALMELAHRGHVLHLAADRPESSGGLQMVERLAASSSSITVGWTPRRGKDDEWLATATRIRLSQDYLRYLEHDYDNAPQLRRRAKERTPEGVVRLVEQLGFRRRPGRRLLRALLYALEHGLPHHAAYHAFLQEQRPDVVIFTPLIDLGSPQLDLLKSAKALGLRTVLAVGSWDHLSSKALIRIRPDLVTVWNHVQEHEALAMHQLPTSIVAVTGAQCYDQWFDRQPSRTREEFCRNVGLDPARLFVLYVCSSLFRGGPPEAAFTTEWIQAIRTSGDPRLKSIGILLRPHPGRMDEWSGIDVTSLGVAFHGRNPIDDEARRDYFDALYYSGAVVGLNTSAFLEAAIVGRPVLTVLPKAYWKSQKGTLHFHYLLSVGGGVLRTSGDLAEHLTQLADAVSGTMATNNEAFVRDFIRPHGRDVAATPRFADAIEALSRQPAPVPWRSSASALIGRPLLRSAAALRHASARWRRGRKDAQHELKKTRERALRVVRRPLKQFSDRQLSTNRRPVDGVGAEARAAVSALRSSGRPIMVGPWLSETGFELLYWIPFVRWAQKYGHLRPDRLIAISRGGVESWYRGITDRYIDVFDLMSAAAFRDTNEARIAAQDGQKHFDVAPFDEEIVAQAAARAGVSRYDWLHPGLMYNLFRPFWMQQAPIAAVTSHTVARPLRLQTPGRVGDLPSRYVAVKFYSNQALPDAPQNRAFVTSVLNRLANRHHVVLLQTGLAIDDHGEFGAAGARIHTAEHLMTPRNNLDIQTRIIAGADALVTTYGGFSYLGPMLGIKTLAFYSDPQGFRRDHLDVAERTFRDLQTPPFVTLRTDEVETLDTLLGPEHLAVAQ